MSIIIILNKKWNNSDLIATAQKPEIKKLISEYKSDENCRAYDWICGEKISDIEKASFIYSCLNGTN